MWITSQDQVTIPAQIRKPAGLLPHAKVDIQFDGQGVRIVRSKRRDKDSRGARLVAHLRGRGDIDLSTDALMKLTRSE
jgi:bifunctional DNA-binding transcriptional regulator/antitoxin component of YhaV-PrlF toxin-antitoxin module